MSKKKKPTAKKKLQKRTIKLNWQKIKWPLALTVIALALLASFALIIARGIPVETVESPNGRIAFQVRWKGFGHYVTEYAANSEGDELEADLRHVRKLVAVEFTATSRYAMLVYKGPQGRQYFYVIDYMTGVSGTVDPASIFNTDLPDRQGITDVKVTFVAMDPQYDAASFRVDYVRPDGTPYYEHITYNFNADHLK